VRRSRRASRPVGGSAQRDWAGCSIAVGPD
jgi:hypothetical protein